MQKHNTDNHNMDIGKMVRRAMLKQQEAQYSVPGAINQARPVADPQSQTAATRDSFNSTSRVVYGTITDCTAIGNVYRVQLEKFAAPMVAYLGTNTSSGTTGARLLNTLRPGTVVSCVVHTHANYAQILGVIPPPGSSANLNQHTVLHGSSRNRVDEAHKRPFRMSSSGGIPALLAGRPLDATNVGEAGWITETGIKIFIDSFMAMMGLDESCQLSFFYHDMLCRLAGYQLQIWSSAREMESINDQDESQDWTGYAMYPWEQMGLEARADPTKFNDAQTWQIDNPYYSRMEPIDDYLMPWHREREWHGYLGQGFKRSLVAPPTEFSASGDSGSQGQTDLAGGTQTQYTAFSGSDGGIVEGKHPGLADSFVTLDGRMCFQSAKGISFTKRSAIMLPVRKNKPEDPTGDTPDNYKFSSLLGEGPDHAITGDITTNDHAGFNRAMGVMDLHAYIFNYAGIHPFFYHNNDYTMYEESEADWTDGKSAEIPDYTTLLSESYIDPEDYEKTWDIDHRYEEQKFYTLSSNIAMLDDGGIMISDGYGSSIRMSGGSIELSCPGDIWLKSGRNTNTWAGNDVIIRAKNSWDITATDKDGRLKAEKNLFQLAGNGGTGGVLIESKGSSDTLNFDNVGESVEMSGIVLRSTNAPIVNWSNQIYLRTGGGGGTAGPIILDAGKGESNILTYANDIQNFTQTGEYWHFGSSDESVQGPSSAITEQSTILSGDINVNGGIIASGNAIFDGTLTSTKNIVAIECEAIGCLEGENLKLVQDQLAQSVETIEKTTPEDIGQSQMDSVLVASYYDDQKPGHDTTIRKGKFSLRTREDYRTTNFKLYEDLWQQLGRLSSQSLGSWEEQPVTGESENTYPYPGRENFETGESYIQQDLEIFDPQNGRSKDRGSQPDLNSEYSDPQFGTANQVSLNQYTVLR